MEAGASTRRWGFRVGAVSTLMVVGLVAVAIYLAACTADMRPYQAALDSLAIPPDWSLVHVTVQEPGGHDKLIDPNRRTDEIDCAKFLQPCPYVARYYLADGPPAAVLAQARAMLAATGLAESGRYSPACDGVSGSAACGVRADAGAHSLNIDIGRPGEPAFGLTAYDRTLVRVTVEDAR